MSIQAHYRSAPQDELDELVSRVRREPEAVGEFLDPDDPPRWERALRIAWWVLILTLGIGVGFLFYAWPAIAELEDMSTALQAETAWGRVRLAVPGLLGSLVFAPLPVAFAYRCGSRLPKSLARRGALTFGLIVVGCSLTGAVVYVAARQVYPAPFRLILHLRGQT